jgi:hypothetical protein
MSVKRIDKLIKDLPKEGNKEQIIIPHVNCKPITYIPSILVRNVSGIERDGDKYKINLVPATSDNKYIKSTIKYEKRKEHF